MSDVAGCPFFDRSVCADFNPLIKLIVCVELGGKTGISILLASYDTVIVKIVYRSEEVAFVITVLESDRMLSGPAGAEDFFHPVCFLRIVIVNAIGFTHCLHVIAGHFFVFDPVFCTEKLRCLA